jgi:hypothetical protein
MPPLSAADHRLMEQLNRHPDLKARMESLLAVVEDAGDDLIKADAAEQRVIEELRQMGNEVLTGWASTRAGKIPVLPAYADAAPLRRAGKKSSIGTPRSEKST